MLSLQKKLSSLQRLLRTTSANLQIENSKYHKRWYYFAAHRHNVTLCCEVISSFVILLFLICELAEVVL